MEGDSTPKGAEVGEDLVDHVTVDLDAALHGMDLTDEQRLGLEAMAAVISFGYRDEDGGGFGEAVEMARRWDVVSVLLGPDWNDPDVAAAVEQGAERERFERAAARQRDLLLLHAAWVGRWLASVRAP